MLTDVKIQLIAMKLVLKMCPFFQPFFLTLRCSSFASALRIKQIENILTNRVSAVEFSWSRLYRLCISICGHMASLFADHGTLLTWHRKVGIQMASPGCCLRNPYIARPSCVISFYALNSQLLYPADNVILIPDPPLTFQTGVLLFTKFSNNPGTQEQSSAGSLGF